MSDIELPAIRWKLRDLLAEAGLEGVAAKGDPIVTGIADNSSHVEKGNLFVATRGTKVDSHLYVSDAVERGATAVIVERETPAYAGVRIVKVGDSRDALGRLAHAFYGNPSREMLVVGVTGTNGKTTTTYLAEAVLKEAGYKPGVIGTIEYRYAGKSREAKNTTPSAVELAKLFAEMKLAGVNAVAMESSSHAIDQERIAGIEFDAGIFTNLTQDHLDYHGTMEAYALAKKRFFFDYLLRQKAGESKSSPIAAFNLDDECGRRFADEFQARKITFSASASADVTAGRVSTSIGGTRFPLTVAGAQYEADIPLLGMFNVSNSLGVIAAMTGLGIAPEIILSGLKKLGGVPGRFEKVDAGQDFMVVVDYAHTPDALELTLKNARSMTRGKVIAVFGCGGDRDNAKRPLMGRIAGDLSDSVILTNDNPRTEDPERIAAMAIEGIKHSAVPANAACVILDRREAIAKALSIAAKGDIVVIAGKGHENYQILNDCTIHFDDRETARELLSGRATL